jgi:putative solute:sodium symporter small subunit
VAIMASPTNDQVYWEKTSRLMWLSLAIWAFFAFVIHFFVHALNKVVILGFPLGFYMAAQGSLIAFVLLIFWYANRQHRIDVECGVDETADDASRG